MTSENTEPVIEETRIHPGDKYRPDGTFDLDMKVGGLNSAMRKLAG